MGAEAAPAGEVLSKSEQKRRAKQEKLAAAKAEKERLKQEKQAKEALAKKEKASNADDETLDPQVRNHFE